MTARTVDRQEPLRPTERVGRSAKALLPGETDEIQDEVASIVSLVVAEAQRRGIAPDDPRADDIHEWAVHLPHSQRLEHLHELREHEASKRSEAPNARHTLPAAAGASQTTTCRRPHIAASRERPTGTTASTT